MADNYGTAILFTTIAGLSTTIGSVIALFYKKPSPAYMTLTLGFSAGVMIFVSFVELLQSGIESLGFFWGNLAFFAGIILMAIIDITVSHTYELESGASSEKSKTEKMALLVALGIMIHNFPEGMATFAGTLKDTSVGFSLMFAIAIHNIPEGIAVSTPVFAASGSSKKAFLWSFLSGASEPVGAIIAALILSPFLNDAVLGFMLSLVAGFMVFISFDELLPATHSYGKEHLAIAGIIGGMAVMAFSLAIM